ncbi:MAG: tetratricopeptide repeat protein [Bacteroidota bacterium]
MSTADGDNAENTPLGAGTPWFARVASGLLEAGDAAAALRVCRVGTKAFPRYATGHLMLGKCYDALGRHVEAMLEYRQVIDVFPDNPVVGALLRNAEERQQQAFAAFAEARQHTLQGTRNRTTFEEYIAEGEKARETSMEQIIRKLEDAPRQIAPPVNEDVGAAPPPEHPSSARRLVTATLAEIYASQGEYDEAIEAYQKLAAQRPGSAERYQQRLRELEELKRSSTNGTGR